MMSQTEPTLINQFRELLEEARDLDAPSVQQFLDRHKDDPCFTKKAKFVIGFWLARKEIGEI